MFLNGDQIEKQLSTLITHHGDERCISEVCYELRIGDEVFIPEEKYPITLCKEKPYVLLPPGQFALVKTLEEVYVPPEYVGLISIRSKFKFQGLINISGFHVDPTYKGHLVFAVQNVGPSDIRLLFEDRTFMMMWARLDERLPDRLHRKKPGYQRIDLDQMSRLGGSSITIASLRKEVESLTLTVKIHGALALAALIAILGLLIRALSGK